MSFRCPNSIVTNHILIIKIMTEGGRFGGRKSGREGGREGGGMEGGREGLREGGREEFLLSFL